MVQDHNGQGIGHQSYDRDLGYNDTLHDVPRIGSFHPVLLIWTEVTTSNKQVVSRSEALLLPKVSALRQQRPYGSLERPQKVTFWLLSQYLISRKFDLF